MEANDDMLLTGLQNGELSIYKYSLKNLEAPITYRIFTQENPILSMQVLNIQEVLISGFKYGV